MDKFDFDIFIYPHSGAEYEVIPIKITVKSELTVGGGVLEQGTSPFDIPVAKMVTDNGFVPYIPGSTLKGLLRARAEELLREYGRRTNANKTLGQVLQDVKDKLSGEDLREFAEKALAKLIQQFYEMSKEEEQELLRNLTLPQPVKELVEGIELSPYACLTTVEGLACELPLRDYKKPYIKALGMSKYPCPVCLTFGAPGYMSNVIVTDAYPPEEKSYAILVRTHVAIDRYTGAAAQGKLFEIEYIAPGSTFKGYIIVRKGETSSSPNNIDEIVNAWKNNREIANMLVRFVLEDMKRNGVMLGRRKSAGMGEIEIETEDINKEDCDKYIEPLKSLCNWARRYA